MPIRSLLAIFALLSPSCAAPRAALVTGTVIAVLGGVAMANTHVRDCSSPGASELCGFDQLHDQINQGIATVIMLGGVAVIFAGLAGLSTEHTRHPASPVPTAPAAPPTAPLAPAAPPSVALDSGWQRTTIGRDLAAAGPRE
jgi:hypothetical protein